MQILFKEIIHQKFNIMKLDATLVGVIIILLIIVPVGYMIVSSSSKNKKVINALSKLSQSRGINLSNIDVIGNLVIGIDENEKKLVYTSKLNVESDMRVVNLSEVKECRAKSIKVSDKTLQWVGLELAEKTGKKEIQFYSESDESGLTKDPFICYQDAKRWENTLRPLLKAA